MAQVVRYRRYTLFVNIYYQYFIHVGGTGKKEMNQINLSSLTRHADSSCVFFIVKLA
jgi:hypothetical protein